MDEKKKEWRRCKIITDKGKYKYKRNRKNAVGFLEGRKAHFGVLAVRSICVVVFSSITFSCLWEGGNMNLMMIARRENKSWNEFYY